MRRTASWIWRDRGVSFGGQISPRIDANVFVHFRRTLDLDVPPQSAPIHISADGRYRLFVNGTYIGRGPARCEPLFQYYDVYDVAPHLRPGRNTVAVLVHSYGRDMSWYELPRTDWATAFGCGGLFVESGALPALNTGTSWRYAVADAWESDSPPGSVGFAEVYDARRALEGWETPAFDDASWADAVVLETAGRGIAPAIVPFPYMVERDIPPLLEEPRDAARVLSVVELPAAPDADLLALAEAAPEPLSASSVENIDGLLGDAGAAELRLAPGRAVSIVIDFGLDVTGYPRLDVAAPAGVNIDVSYAEQLRRDGRTAVQRPNPITGQNVHRYITRDGRQAWEKFDRAGFRYLQLTVSAPSSPATSALRIHRADINFTSYPVGDRGAFACSDDALTRIWRAGAYTLQLCMQDGFEDCPSREQRQWVGDAYVESMVNYACFGDAKLTAKLLRQVAQSQRRDGMTQMATPGDASARWPVYIVDYCLSWIMAAGEHALHTGDTTVIPEIFPSVARAVAWFERHMDPETGLVFDPPGWMFIDWAEVDRRGASAALNALLVQGLHHAAAMADSQGATALATRWRAHAGRIAKAINENHWDEARGVYVDALLAPDPASQAAPTSSPRAGRRVSQQSNAAIIAAGIAPPDRAARALDYVMDPARLVVTSTNLDRGAVVAIDEERQVVLAQPFFMHFVHRALAAAGRHDAVVENIRRHWSPMLADDGVDSLWEHWHGKESRCHAWSATPTYDLSRQVLGVRPLVPAFERFALEPHLAGLEWAEGTFPTPHGDIAVSWRRDGARLQLDVSVPSGTVAELSLPYANTINLAGRGESGSVALQPGRHTVSATLA